MEPRGAARVIPHAVATVGWHRIDRADPGEAQWSTASAARGSHANRSGEGGASYTSAALPLHAAPPSVSRWGLRVGQECSTTLTNALRLFGHREIRPPGESEGVGVPALHLLGGRRNGN